MTAPVSPPEAVQQASVSPFEARFLAQYGRPLPPLDPAQLAALPRCSPRTDLHTHFAGCPRAGDLLRIALEADAHYPAELLTAAGLRGHQGGVRLAAVPEEHRKLLEKKLSIPLDRRITFGEMERIYRLRQPLIRPVHHLPALLRQLAQDYAQAGIERAELSWFGILDPAAWAVAHDVVPALERELGVELRFLVALSRHDDPEWTLDCIELLQAIGPSRLIAGVDFMGHETCSTRQLAGHISRIADWAHHARPGFVIRVHAGENAAYPENIRVALDAVEGRKVKARIGHGLYGADPATLKRLAATETIVEFNLTSNLALNNIRRPEEVPIAKYVAAGVKVVLGTDGYGLYQTDPAFEARAALLCGLSIDDLEQLRETERSLLEEVRDRERSLPERPIFPAPSAPKHYDEARVRAAAIEAREQARLKLTDRLRQIRAEVLDEESVERLLTGKYCISVAGSWRESFSRLSDRERGHLTTQLRELVAGLDPERFVLITGGTALGVEGIVSREARARGFTVLGTPVLEQWDAPFEPGTLSHAYVIAQRLTDKGASLYRWMHEHGGFCLFFGGGGIVGDELQIAHNLRLPYRVFRGVSGAAADHAELKPELSFAAVGEILPLLLAPGSWYPPRKYHHPGVNPSADAVVLRSGSGGIEVLLIQRSPEAPTEPGKWALPGGFVRTTAPRGEPWSETVETPLQACLRELEEETGIDAADLASQLLPIGTYEGGGRDPRDGPDAWSRAHVFALQLAGEDAERVTAASGDAADARWWPVDRLPARVAFDHRRLIQDTLSHLGR